MAEFNITGSNEPFLHVSMKKGDKIYCESDALVMKEQNLVVSGAVRGGIFKSAFRKLTTGESFFQQSIEAKNGEGECLLAPPLSGDLQILNVGQNQYMLSDGSYVASTSNVEIDPKIQSNLGGAIFGGTGGFVIMQTKGNGQVCVSGGGNLMELEVTHEQGETTVDNGHVVAWDANLKYSIGLPDSGGGLIGNVVNSVVGGEGLVLKFKGQGKVIICSRKRIKAPSTETETVV